MNNSNYVFRNDQYLYGVSIFDKIEHYLLSYGTGYSSKRDGENVVISWEGDKNYSRTFNAESLERQLRVVASSEEIYKILEDSECYTINRGDEFLVIEDREIGWSRYFFDAAVFDTEEAAEDMKRKLGITMCGISWRSSRKPSAPLMIPKYMRVTPGVVGHPTGGKVLDTIDHLYAAADEYLANSKKIS